MYCLTMEVLYHNFNVEEKKFYNCLTTALINIFYLNYFIM